MVIDTLQLDIIVNNKGTTARINATTKALKDLHKVISDINGSGGVDGAVNGGGGSYSGGNTSRGSGARRNGANVANSLKRSLNLGSMVAKLYFVRNVTKQLGQDLAKVVQYGIDYEETLNLWQVAMKDNIAQARIFVSEMNKAYGISSATVMNYQATFKNMLSALGGISQDTAYGLSEALSQMALDYASLYNTSIESAMTKFQAVLAGQVRPIRSESGYDITEQTLFQLYQSLGGQKSVRQLDQMEKRLLRILAVYKQMQGTATGDLSKTIRSSANQLRIMKEQAVEFATWIGVAGNTLLENSGILITLNAYLYAAAALAKQFAISLGYVEKDYTPEEPIQEMNTELDNANKSVDALKGKLLGFDKFQVLSSAGVETDNVDLAAEITKAIEEYERILGKAENPAFQKSLDLLKAWGLELDENGNIVGGFDKVKEKVADITKSLGGMLALVGIMTKPWLVLVSAIEYAYWTNEEFRESVNVMLKQLGGSGIKVFKAMGELFIKMSPHLVRIVEEFTQIVGLLDELGLLEETIGLVVVGLIAWKNAQTILNIMTFVKNLQTQIRVMRLLRTETTMLNSGMLLAGTGVGKLGMIMQNTYTKTMLLVAGMSLLSSGFMDLQGWSDMSGLERASTILKIVAGAAFLAASAIAAFHTSWSVGVAAGAIAVGVAAIVASMATASAAAKDMQKNIEAHANGGLATKGSLFYAGEAGPELVTRTSGGNSTIMNMAQLENAVAKGMFRALAGTQANESEQVVNVGIDGQNLFTIFRGVAKRNGYDLVKVN